jgi:hypothetical protein
MSHAVHRIHGAGGGNHTAHGYCKRAKEVKVPWITVLDEEECNYEDDIDDEEHDCEPEIAVREHGDWLNKHEDSA